ncbi:MAG TPA: aminotransferase class I/II-fold pyridoxal phosphate-dependent enzyme [Euryarchaeota archaeon]|nr:aminotransferase class I/II-fold pyridoxal phosphate-dependent enzyme [Euryarchaeota archaeon]
MLDEAYKEFSESSMAELTETYSNLVVTGTFSKAFGLAGLRAGYCACNTALKELILKVKQPFNVSFVAQNAALAALKDVEHLERSVKLARNGREYIIKRARGLGLKAYDSQGNFVLIKVEGKPEIVEDLFRKGIIVRGCGSFPGLSEEYFRVSVGLEDENKMFVDSLREIV